MRPYCFAIASAFFATAILSTGASAEDCAAERYAAAQDIQTATGALEAELGPYEAAIFAGDVEAFDAAAHWVVGPWQDLLAIVDRRRARLSAAGCPLHGIPEEARLPGGWQTVRDIGIWQAIGVDRNITMHNAAARIAHAAHVEP
ncbi:hypothetical protein [Microvirga pudoricolor]|uniref:hypothetical protein n=1 Tax=Microvirga pudoricolor TaxID=2778729 RepID=UPI00194F71D9|nr:hypothetical protein [Microvirga pudoricolor]MBM6594271.1 hypothetical protein [Microvirga pudoricolor]